MSNVFRMHQQVDLAIHRDGNFGGHDVIFRIWSWVGVETGEIGVGLH